ncbi:MAG: hypothetical protein ACFFFH_21295 [Candidatus Thorarchaeota archaeon]
MIHTNLQDRKLHWRDFSATRVVASTLGVLLGLGGMEHGFFEMLQGNVTPTSYIIDAIGPEQELWPGAAEPALTIIPNFFVTGILAITVGLLVTIYSAVFIQRKYSARSLFILSVLLLLVGGGAGPLFSGILVVILVTRINKPLLWWRDHLSVNVRDFLRKTWPWSLITYVTMNLFTVVVTITGWPFILFFNEIIMIAILYILGNIGLVFMVFAILSAFAYDIQNQSDTHLI